MQIVETQNAAVVLWHRGKMKIIANNKKAFHDYDVIERFEAGLVLSGTEVKSAKDGNINLKESFIKILTHEAWLINCHISEYNKGNINNHVPTRSRKLLMHRKELDKLESKLKEKGLTLVALKIYINKKNLLKVDVGLCKGKKDHDKRQALREKDLNREAQRELKNII